MTTAPRDEDDPSRKSAPDRQFEMAKLFVRYQFGSLWWGRDDLIHEKQPEFVEREDRIGHPLVSVKRDDLHGRSDCVPMLVGTSGKRLRSEIRADCVPVRGLTAGDPDHVSYFGSIVEPGLYDFGNLMDGVEHKEHAFRRPENAKKRSRIVASEPVPWFELRVMHPNQDKRRVDEDEGRALDRFCRQHGF